MGKKPALALTLTHSQSRAIDLFAQAAHFPLASASGQPVRIALIDDDPSIHLAMRQIFKTLVANWKLDSYLDGKQALDHIAKTPPHAVLMDISMPEITGIECTKLVKALLPDLPVIMFTARADTESFISAMIAGASGYLIKPVASADVIVAIKKALTGLPILCVETEKAIIRWLRNLGQQRFPWKLTAREHEIMIHVCCNRSDKEIAHFLQISPGTVHTHVVKIFKKLGVKRREQAKRKFIGADN